MRGAFSSGLIIMAIFIPFAVAFWLFDEPGGVGIALAGGCSGWLACGISHIHERRQTRRFNTWILARKAWEEA